MLVYTFMCARGKGYPRTQRLEMFKVQPFCSSALPVTLVQSYLITNSILSLSQVKIQAAGREAAVALSWSEHVFTRIMQLQL